MSGKKIIGNAFSVNMLNQFPAKVEVNKVSAEEFCEVIRDSDIINAIGHEGTATLINALCGTNLKANRIQISLSQGDILYAVTLSFRLEEGKIYNAEELQKLYNEGKISFYKVHIQ